MQCIARCGDAQYGCVIFLLGLASVSAQLRLPLSPAGFPVLALWPCHATPCHVIRIPHAGPERDAHPDPLHCCTINIGVRDAVKPSSPSSDSPIDSFILNLTDNIQAPPRNPDALGHHISRQRQRRRRLYPLPLSLSVVVAFAVCTPVICLSFPVTKAISVPIPKPSTITKTILLGGGPGYGCRLQSHVADHAL